MNKLRLKIQGLLILFLLIQGTVNAQKDTLSFLHITDLHTFFSQDNYHPEITKYRNQKQYDQGVPHLRQFLKTVPAKTHSKLVVATGDLVDFFEAESATGEMLNIQVRRFADLVKKYPNPILFTLGNHDAFSFNWGPNKMLHDQNSVERARAKWIQTMDCFKEGTYYSRLYQVGKTTYRFIFLDNIFYVLQPAKELEVPYVDKPQIQWLKTQLQQSDKDVEIIFMHIPFPDSISQAGSSNELYKLLTHYPSARLILAGHQHKNLVSKFPSENNHTLTQVQTGALVKTTDNWRLIRLTENKILVSVPGKTDDDIVIPLK